MAKYDINHTCGHTVTVQLFGPGKDRQSTIAWLETKPCMSCQRAQDLTAAQKSAKDIGLPDLTGTEKQIAWATKIRATVYDGYKKYMQDQSEDIKKSMTDFELWIWPHAESKWWIETKSFHPVRDANEQLIAFLSGVGYGAEHFSWRNFYAKYKNIDAEAAEKELKEQKAKELLEKNKKTTADNNAKFDKWGLTSISIWTSSSNPNDTRIYGESDTTTNHLIFSILHPEKTDEKYKPFIDDWIRLCKWKNKKLNKK